MNYITKLPRNLMLLRLKKKSDVTLSRRWVITHMTITVTTGTMHCLSDRLSTYGTQPQLQDPEVHRKEAEYSLIPRIKTSKPGLEAASADPYPVSKGLLTDPVDQGYKVGNCGRIQPDPPPFFVSSRAAWKRYKRDLGKEVSSTKKILQQ